MNRRAQLLCVWAGPLCAALFALGAVVLARWIPPYVHPGDSAQEVARIFTEHQDRIRIGTLIALISMSLVGPWGAVISAQVRRMEGNNPIVSYVMLLCCAVGTTIVVLMCCCWGVAVFRPDDQSPEITRAMNDLGYFFFLFTAFPFCIWAGTLAFAIFSDEAEDVGEEPVYPRWLGYLSAWTAVLFFPAGLILFFKEGPFGWAGVMALYVPVLVFFLWLAGICYCTIRNVKHRGMHYDRKAGRPARDSELTAA